MVKKMKFKINNSGEVEVSVDGATGNECEALTADFENRLGPIAQRTFKESYYQENDLNHSATVDGGSRENG